MCVECVLPPLTIAACRLFWLPGWCALLGGALPPPLPSTRLVLLNPWCVGLAPPCWCPRALVLGWCSWCAACAPGRATRGRLLCAPPHSCSSRTLILLILFIVILIMPNTASSHLNFEVGSYCYFEVVVVVLVTVAVLRSICSYSFFSLFFLYLRKRGAYYYYYTSKPKARSQCGRMWYTGFPSHTRL